MRFLFLNQYFPPDPAPTGTLFGEIAEMLRAEGHDVDFVAARQDYRAGQKQGGRTIRELMALARMLVDSMLQRRADVVISGTSPPCLLVVATLVALKFRARSVHWNMDMYPEIAVALGEIGPGRLARAAHAIAKAHFPSEPEPVGFLAGVVGAVMGWSYRRSTVVALDEDMAVRVRRHGVEPVLIRPWVFAPVLKQLAAAKAEPTAEWTWIYSGNLGRAHEWETLLGAQKILEDRGAEVRLLFQGGGPSWPAAQARARELGLKCCEWRGYVPEAELPESLRRCAVLAVTQLPAAQGLLWPSKLGLVLSLPRAILWVGPTDGAIASLLRQYPHTGVFAPGQAVEVAEWLLARHAKATAVAPALDPAAHRAEALREWKRVLTSPR
jgi:colanic acid biosynthesis glycosyl transferase WcaI